MQVLIKQKSNFNFENLKLKMWFLQFSNLSTSLQFDSSRHWSSFRVLFQHFYLENCLESFKVWLENLIGHLKLGYSSFDWKV